MKPATSVHDPAVTADLELVPESLDRCQRLRLLACRHEMRGQTHAADHGKLVQLSHSLVGDHRRVAGDLAREDDVERLEEQGLRVLSLALSKQVVEIRPQVEEVSELLAVSRQRTARLADS